MTIPAPEIRRTIQQARDMAGPEDTEAFALEAPRVIDRLVQILDLYVDHEPTLAEEAEYVQGRHRAEALAEAGLLPKADVVAWLTKKARENTPVWQLASKVERGAVRPNNLEMLPADFFEPEHTYTAGPWTFRCDAVTTHPETGERTALGWTCIGSSGWVAYSELESAWAVGKWTETTDGGAA